MRYIFRFLSSLYYVRTDQRGSSVKLNDVTKRTGERKNRHSDARRNPKNYKLVIREYKSIG